MFTSTSKSLDSIGFGGDGDEVDALLALEHHFDVSISTAESDQWRTAGDVFEALLRALPENQRASDDLWPIFAHIMCAETGADATRLGQDTLLLAPPISTLFRQWLRTLFGKRP